METIRTLIVDDEPLAREGVRLHLEEHADFEVIGECGSGEEAVSRIEADSPDLVFLDVQMPGLDGFGVLEALGSANRLPAVVFITAYDQFALRAFEAHALDYLLKPLEAERFGKALDRVRGQLQSRAQTPMDERLRSLLASLGARENYLERMVARTNGRIIILRVDDVDWIEAAANYVRVHIAQKQYLVRETMTNLETRLDPDRFLRIHRSIIVRKDRIKELEPLFQGDYSLVLSDGTRLTSSRGYRDRIQQFLQGVT
ncbi:MAG TPA: LytTR family DNA-binding domain-containing protein [Longimicrobiales bacterium]|nr:LytTR family DNA-binding domain-containing protein [Longimicrobiales bacterium]